MLTNHAIFKLPQCVTRIVIAFLLIAMFGCQVERHQTILTAQRGSVESRSDWPLHGNDTGEQRYSPLTTIHTENVERLGLAWWADMDSTRGLEATPIVVDGVMYVTSTWSRVFAFDAKSGRELWRYDPKVDRAWAKRLCCDIVNRGVAVSGDSLVFGTLDGYLIALNKNDGSEQWKSDTLVDREQWYSITGAPRIVKGQVIIGNGGAEYSVRGYVSAYDLKDGALNWRFYTVPGSKQGPHEHAELKMAAETWADDSNWTGGGATAWDSMAYDPELDLLYIGTGNGSPWNRENRSPGGGDNLFISSILALEPDSGRLRWHYQVTPGDNWDYTATQHMILADLQIDGQIRKVLMQAPKNGFFYVLDRETGELISAEKFVYVNWASHVDLASGRPVETGLGDYAEGEAYVFPSPAGGHNWHPMSYSPQTGLVYFSARDIGWVFNPTEDYWFTYGFDDPQALAKGQELPETRGYLKAWDPVAGELAWQLESDLIWNGGTLATAGGLVFYGNAAGEFLALDAASGEILKTIDTGVGIIAPPISYSIDGEQYVAVMAGWGGPAFNTMQGGEAAVRYQNAGRLLVFKLGGGSLPMPPLQIARGEIPPQPEFDVGDKVLEEGRQLYGLNCGACHGYYGSRPLLPDLRYLTPEKHRIFDGIVRGGMLEPKGMPRFSELSAEQTLAIQAYIAQMANDSRE